MATWKVLSGTGKLWQIASFNAHRPTSLNECQRSQCTCMPFVVVLWACLYSTWSLKRRQHALKTVLPQIDDIAFFINKCVFYWYY